jgi:hypothetical protein
MMRGGRIGKAIYPSRLLASYTHPFPIPIQIKDCVSRNRDFFFLADLKDVFCTCRLMLCTDVQKN